MLTKLKIRNWKEIPTKDLSHEEKVIIEASLLLENPVWRKTKDLGYSVEGKTRWIKCWGEVNGNTLVPRHFGESRFQGDANYLSHPVKWPNTSWSPRPHQVVPLEELVSKKEGVLILPCGSGKSIIALLHLQQLCQRALVLVPSRTLKSQWKDYFKEIFGVDDGVKLATSKDWRAGKYLTIATYQQIALHPLPKEFHDQFGVVIYDEVDVANAVQLSLALPKFNSYRIGLTATKTREDGMDVLSDLHVGKTLFEMTKMEDSVMPSIYIQDTGIFLSTKSPMATAITHVSESVNKMDLVLYLVKRALNKGRKVFVLCERIAQAELYHAEAVDKNLDASLVHAKLSEKEKDFSGQVIFATQMLGRGFNDEDLDTLIVTGLFAYSVREFRQLLGRVQRVKKGKKRVVVVIMQDRHPMLTGKLRKILGGTEDLFKEVQYF